jgi:hypothetical protein
VKAKQDFQQEIDYCVQRRKDTLTELVNATKNPIVGEEVIRLAEEAYECLVKIRDVRGEMRSVYPTNCNCNCHKEGETE